MKKEIYSCDRCGAKLEEECFNINYYNILTEEQTRYRIKLFKSFEYDGVKYDNYDLCEKCRKGLEEWLNGKDT